jgi:hypothetical protein
MRIAVPVTMRIPAAVMAVVREASMEVRDDARSVRAEAHRIRAESEALRARSRIGRRRPGGKEARTPLARHGAVGIQTP